MTDRQLAVYLNIIDWPNWQEAITALPPERRALFERMSKIEVEIDLWDQGLGPKPTGVLIDRARTPASARGMVARLRKHSAPKGR
jgi:hypothetical protein